MKGFLVVCGISGIISKSNNPIPKEQIKSINDLISHRGPDDEGFYFYKNFAFGHRRLAILDLSKLGHQPMSYMKKYTITYNGEIYNYIEIKNELVKHGYKFKSNTDTEVILASYDKWGEDCVKRFNGMWAFALHDKEKNIIFCSRDRFGIKPFYYTQIDDKFVFGSEIKQLLEFHKKRFVNENILIEYLLYGLVEHTQETFFRDIYKLEQSHNLIYDLHTKAFKIKKYFDLEINDELKNLNTKESIEKLKGELSRSIVLRLRSDVKVGTCLSGGLDSSSIAAIVSKKYTANSDKKFTAIHAKSIEKKTDESKFAREVSKHCRLNLSEVEPSLDDITNRIEEVIFTQEEPFGGISIFMQYFVMKKAKEIECKVMLDGQGGDETLFGYEGYYPFYFASLLVKGKIARYFKSLKEISVFRMSKKKIALMSIFLIFRDKLSFVRKIYKRKKIAIKIPYDETRLAKCFKFEEFKKFQKKEMMSNNLPALLRYEDKNSMKHSIETRLPFLDYKFAVSAILSRDDLKFKNGYLKFILRKIVENILPKGIVWRKNKFGFEAPSDMWTEQNRDKMINAIEKSTILDTILLNKPVYSDSILWKLYNVAVWEKIYNVQIREVA